MTQRQAYLVGALLACILLLSLPPSVTAFAVNPHSQQLTNPNDEVYVFVYSIVNSDPQPRQLHLELDPFSKYLESRVKFSKDEFALLPGQTENIQVSVQPAGLGPQTHTLKVGVYDKYEKVDSFELLMVMPGTPVEDYKVALQADDTHSDSAVPLTVTISNYGNIIGYAKVSLEIIKSGQVVDTVSNPNLLQVLPNDKVVYGIPYSAQLEPGFYTARVTATFPDTNVTAEDQFSVQLEQSTQRINMGSDLVLTFASLGNPSKIGYSLTDENGKQVAAGTFMPQTGDAIIPTSKLPAGTYELVLDMPGGEQRSAVVIRDEGKQLRLLFVLVVIVVLGYAAYSMRGRVRLAVRIFLLERAIARRQDEVANLINRSHRLVDEYSAHARHGQASGAPGKTGEGP